MARRAATRLRVLKVPDLVVWQLANQLKRDIYAFTTKPPASRDFKLDRGYLTADEHLRLLRLTLRALNANENLQNLTI